MAICEVCGNHYDKSLEVHLADEAYIFDSFECAFYEVTPTCAHCHRPAVNHGIVIKGVFFCCANCASESDAVGLQHYIYQHISETSRALEEAFC